MNKRGKKLLLSLVAVGIVLAVAVPLIAREVAYEVELVTCSQPTFHEFFDEFFGERANEILTSEDFWNLKDAIENSGFDFSSYLEIGGTGEPSVPSGEIFSSDEIPSMDEFPHTSHIFGSPLLIDLDADFDKSRQQQGIVWVQAGPKYIGSTPFWFVAEIMGNGAIGVAAYNFSRTEGSIALSGTIPATDWGWSRIFVNGVFDRYGVYIFFEGYVRYRVLVV